MPGEDRNEIHILLEELLARDAARETIQTQLMIRIASMFDQPQEFVRLVMMHAEENLRRGAAKATGKEKARADNAISYFESYSMRLLAGFPKGRAQ